MNIGSLQQTELSSFPEELGRTVSLMRKEGEYKTIESRDVVKNTNFARSYEPGETKESENIAQITVVRSKELKSGTVEGSLQSAVLQKQINAVVSRVTEDAVFINCQLPHDTVEMSLPIHSVPDSLAAYGVPVSLSIETIEGYKQPVIRPRDIRQSEEVKKELQVIDSWLDTL